MAGMSDRCVTMAVNPGHGTGAPRATAQLS
jgi:hypothetical protein